MFKNENKKGLIILCGVVLALALVIGLFFAGRHFYAIRAVSQEGKQDARTQESSDRQTSAEQTEPTVPTTAETTAKVTTTAAKPSASEANVKVAAGSTHSMALHQDGSLWIWGDNSFGQLGNGKITLYEAYLITENYDEYKPFKLMENITDIAAGDGFSLAVNNKKELYAWGFNHLGQLGDGTRDHRTTPVKVMDDVIFTDAGRNFAIAITGDGTLWRWGYDITGTEWDDLVGTWEHSTKPVLVAKNVKMAAAGGGHILFLAQDNRLFGIGKTSNLGTGNTDPNKHEKKPILIMENVRSAAAGSQTAFALTLDDELYGWGPNTSDGLVGSGSDEFWIHDPELVMKDVQAVFPGGMLLKKDNSLWTWGCINGSVAFRHTSPEGVPHDSGGMMLDPPIVEYGNKPVKVMDNVLTAHSNDQDHILVVDREYNLYTWGDNQFGQLGTGLVNTYEIIHHEDSGGYAETNASLEENNQKAKPFSIGMKLAAR